MGNFVHLKWIIDHPNVIGVFLMQFQHRPCFEYRPTFFKLDLLNQNPR